MVKMIELVQKFLVIKFEQTIICGPRLHIGKTREIKSIIKFRTYPNKYFMF